MKTENIAACRKWIFACAMTMNAIWSCAAEPFALSYRQPARNWFEAMPLGNGRLGAMAFGGVESDCLVLNEDTIWTGRPLERATPMPFLGCCSFAVRTAFDPGPSISR